MAYYLERLIKRLLVLPLCQQVPRPCQCLRPARLKTTKLAAIHVMIVPAAVLTVKTAAPARVKE